MTRTGKIARLPRAVREELNRRLAEGKVGRRLLTWLNSLPEVRTVLGAQFRGRPISEQNLSEWKQGGFKEWRRQEEANAWVGRLVEEAEGLEAAAGAVPLAERMALSVLAGLARLLREAEAAEDGQAASRTMIGVAQQLSILRRANADAERARLARERWQAEQEDRREAKLAKAESARVSARMIAEYEAEVKAAEQRIRRETTLQEEVDALEARLSARSPRAGSEQPAPAQDSPANNLDLLLLDPENSAETDAESG